MHFHNVPIRLLEPQGCLILEVPKVPVFNILGKVIPNFADVVDFVAGFGLEVFEGFTADEPVEGLDLLGQLVNIVDISAFLVELIEFPLHKETKYLEVLAEVLLHVLKFHFLLSNECLMVGDVLLDEVKALVDFFVGQVALGPLLDGPGLHLLETGQALLDELEVHVQELKMEWQVLRSLW